MSRILTAAVGLTLLFIATEARAAVYHVRNAVGANCSDSGAGSSAQPYCTVQACLNKVKSVSPSAGNECWIHEGTYQECAEYYATSSGDWGTATSPIVIRGASGEDPTRIVIDPTGLPIGSCREYNDCRNNYSDRAALAIKGDFSQNASYVRVQDLTVRPTPFESAKACSSKTGSSNQGTLQGNACTVDTDCTSGLTCSAVDHNYGLSLECVQNIEVINVRSDAQPTFNGTCGYGDACGDAVLGIYDGYEVLVQGLNVSNGGVTREGFQAIAVVGSKNVSFVDMRLRDTRGAIAHSAGAKGTTFSFNDIDAGSYTDGDNVIQGYHSPWMRQSWNYVRTDGYITRFRTINSGQESSAILNNNFYESKGGGGTAIEIGGDTGPHMITLVRLRNNIFKGFSTAIRVTPSASGRGTVGSPLASCRFQEDYDAFVSVGTRIDDTDPECSPSLGANVVTTTSNPLNSAGCPLGATASVVDKGDPTIAVPMSGNARVDIGACEYGEAQGAWMSPYTFKVGDTASTATPRITWDGAVDTHVNLKNLDFKEFLAGAAQDNYRCQVDTSYTFNSQGLNKPLWDSGTVTSTNQYCNVATTLTNGQTYWARVKLNDTNWSDYFRFSVSSSGGGAVCGNGVAEAGEVCDGSSLAGQTCASQGFSTGSLGCASNCQSFDTTGCSSGGGPSSSNAVIHFLDVVSAPVGGYVGIVGRNFGASGGKVWFGSTQSAPPVSWSDGKVVVAVPAGAGSPVVVEDAGGGRSAGATFSTHSGTTRWVATTGSDSSSCTQGSPCRTLDRAKNVASAGDVVLARAGRYCENTATNVGLYVRSNNSGTSAQPITYRGYPGEAVTVDCCGTCGGSTFYIEGSNIQVANMKMTGAKGTGVVIVGDNVRVADCESYDNNLAAYAGSSGSGVNIQTSSDGAKVLGCDVHGNGSVDNHDHGFYIKGQNMEVAYNVVYDHPIGYGLQLYDEGTTYTNAKIHSNVVYNNRNAAITVNQGAVNAQVYNNIARNNSRNGITVAGTAMAPTGTKIYNNTVHDNDVGGTGYFQIRLLTGTGAVVKNNVVTSANGRMIQKDSGAGVSSINSNQYGSNNSNSFSWNGSQYNFSGWRSASGQDASSAVGNPLYVNPSSLDLHLQATSPAVDVADGTLVPLLDADGLPRPQGLSCDRGAFEYDLGGGGTNDPPDDVTNTRRTDKH